MAWAARPGWQPGRPGGAYTPAAGAYRPTPAASAWAQRPAAAAAPGRAAQPQPAAAAAQPSHQQAAGGGHQLSADQLFGQKVRRLIDHRLRTPHRRHVDERLLRVIAHWVAIPAGKVGMLQEHATLDVVTTDQSTCPVPSASDAPSNPVNARALLCGGLPPETAQADRHVLKRVEVLAANELSQSRHIRAYGGLCKQGSDAAVVAQLRTMVTEQCGVDLSGVSTWYKFCELEYRSPTPPTVFFLPALWESPETLRICPQAREETEDKEEEYFEKGDEVEGDDKGEDLGETDEEKAQRLKGTKKTRTVTKTTVTKTITPLKFALANLLEFQVQRQTHNDTVELCSAADALDEFLKRECATTILRTLRRRHEEAETRLEERKRLRADETERKRKRDEDAETKKKARKTKEEAIKAQWQDEDEGKTDDEKRASMLKRQQQIRDLREGFREEDKKQAEADEAKRKEEQGGKTKTKSVVRANQDVINGFAYFDRVPNLTRLNGSLPRVKVENVLLCLDEKLTLDEIRHLIAVPGLPENQHAVPYKALGFERIDVPDEDEKAA